jgi:hypothetical protein
MRANPFRGPFEGVWALKIETFLDPEMACALVHLIVSVNVLILSVGSNSVLSLCTFSTVPYGLACQRTPVSLLYKFSPVLPFLPVSSYLGSAGLDV